MRLFSMDLDRLRELLLPVRLRQPRMKAFAKAMLAGLRGIYLAFAAFRADNLYRIRHGQHVAHLTAVLNDAFDPELRRIIVIDAALQYEPLYVFTELEQESLYVFTASETPVRWLYTDHEVEFMGYDFIVKLPGGLTVDADRLRALVEYYKTPGKTWTT